VRHYGKIKRISGFFVEYLMKYMATELNVKVKLLLKTSKGLADFPDEYRKYWFGNFDEFAVKLQASP